MNERHKCDLTWNRNKEETILQRDTLIAIHEYLIEKGRRVQP
jgi:hypothetical protein